MAAEFRRAAGAELTGEVVDLGCSAASSADVTNDDDAPTMSTVQAGRIIGMALRDKPYSARHVQNLYRAGAFGDGASQSPSSIRITHAAVAAYIEQREKVT